MYQTYGQNDMQDVPHEAQMAADSEKLEYLQFLYNGLQDMEKKNDPQILKTLSDTNQKKFNNLINVLYEKRSEYLEQKFLYLCLYNRLENKDQLANVEQLRKIVADHETQSAQLKTQLNKLELATQLQGVTPAAQQQQLSKLQQQVDQMQRQVYDILSSRPIHQVQLIREHMIYYVKRHSIQNMTNQHARQVWINWEVVGAKAKLPQLEIELRKKIEDLKRFQQMRGYVKK